MQAGNASNSSVRVITIVEAHGPYRRVVLFIRSFRGEPTILPIAALSIEVFGHAGSFHRRQVRALARGQDGLLRLSRCGRLPRVMRGRLGRRTIVVACVRILGNHLVNVIQGRSLKVRIRTEDVFHLALEGGAGSSPNSTFALGALHSGRHVRLGGAAQDFARLHHWGLIVLIALLQLVGLLGLVHDGHGALQFCIQIHGSQASL